MYELSLRRYDPDQVMRVEDSSSSSQPEKRAPRSFRFQYTAEQKACQEGISNPPHQSGYSVKHLQSRDIHP